MILKKNIINNILCSTAILLDQCQDPKSQNKNNKNPLFNLPLSGIYYIVYFYILK